MAGKIILYIATSIDGYIARNDGSTNWLHHPSFNIKGEDFGYQKLLDSIDTTLMGNKTYQQVLNFGEPFPYSNFKNYVFSKSKKGHDEYATFINKDIAAFVSGLENKTSQKDIWLIGGAEINTILAEAHLIDEMIITVVPMMLGRGIPLFSKEINPELITLTRSESFSNGFVQNTYRCEIRN